MEGGINAWKGLVAWGAPEAGMAYFEPGSTPEELAALAWSLEEGSRKFYLEMSGRAGAGRAAGLFRELAADEERHRDSLLEFFAGTKPGTAPPDSPASEYLEGGMLLREALEWVREKDLGDALDLSISLEANAADLYIKMERRMSGEKSRQLFGALSNQERDHLGRLSAFLEKS